MARLQLYMQVCNGKQAATASLADNAMHPAHSIGNVTGHLECLSMNNTGKPINPVPVETNTVRVCNKLRNSMLTLHSYRDGACKDVHEQPRGARLPRDGQPAGRCLRVQRCVLLMFWLHQMFAWLMILKGADTHMLCSVNLFAF